MALYAPNDALLFAKTMVKSMPLSDTTVSYQILDYVTSIMWMAAPWRWTLGVLTAGPVTAGTTDYPLTLPTDFSYVESAYLSDANSENTLYIDSFLPVATNAGLPTKLAYIDIVTIPPALFPDVLRVHPKPPASYSATLTALYKKTPPKITSGNYTTAGATGVPDQWFWVFQLGVLWLAYHYADDARGGLAVLGANGQVQYTGFLGAFQSGLDEMRKAEKLPMTPAGTKERG